MNNITLESLIAEGTGILNGISFVPSHSNVTRMFSVYQLADSSIYERWKNVVIRFLSKNYTNDILVPDFRNAMEEFEKKHYAPSSMKKMIGILEAYTVVPSSIAINNSATIPSIVINNSNSQTQNQKQNVEVLVKYIEDAFTLSQLREISQIVNAEDGNMENARPKIIEKIKSFGKNLAPSIVANIITNPSVWASVFGR